MSTDNVKERARQALAEYLTPPASVRDFRSESKLLETAQRGSLLVAPGIENPTETIEYYSWGTGSKRILLVHGWGGKATQYFNFVPALVECGFQVVAFDAPAHGRSTGTFASGPAFARAVRGVAALFGPFAGLIGHSLGGAATVIALAESLGAPRVVLLAPMAFVTPVLESFAQTRNYPPEVIEELLRLFRAKYAERILNVPALVERFEYPALILHDPEDLEIPFSHGQAIAERWPGARLIPVPRLGHWSIMRNKRVIRMAVEFLIGGPVDPTTGTSPTTSE
jgi:pimeloyl-ACP methyl ester carboxylesterase